MILDNEKETLLKDFKNWGSQDIEQLEFTKVDEGDIMYLQTLKKYSFNNRKGYISVYKNKADYIVLFFPINNNFTNTYFPSIIRSSITIGELEDMGAEIL